MVLFFALLQVGIVLVLLIITILRKSKQWRGGAPLGGPEAVVEAAVALGGAGTLAQGSDGMSIPFSGRDFQLTGADFGKQGPRTLYLGTSIARPEGPRSTTAFRDKPGAVAPMPRLAHVVLRRESTKDRWGKRLGLNAEHQTGDARFDDAIYVEHDGDRIGVKHLLAIPELRERALGIVDDPTTIVINGEGHAVALRWASGAAPATPMALREAALALAAFAETIPPIRNLELRSRAGRFDGAALAIVLLGVAFFGAMMVGATQLSRAPVDTAFYRASLVASVVLVLATAAVARVIARGRSRGLALFAWTVGASIGLAPPVVGSTMAGLNAAGVAPDRTEQARVVHLYARSSKGRQSCYAQVAAWRPGLSMPIDPGVNCGFVGRVRPGETATVHLGRGRLGYEWIDSISFERP